MSSADDEAHPSAAGLRSAVSTVMAGVMVVAALSVIRAALLGPDADRSARLFLIVAGAGVWFSLLAVVTAAGVGRHRPLAALISGALVLLGVAAAGVGLFGLSLRLGDAGGGAYEIPLWQLETEPIVAVILGLVACVIGFAARVEPSSQQVPAGSRRLTAVIGASVAAPIIRRLFGRAGDGAASIGWTALLLLFDIIGLVVVAFVAYRGFGFGREFFPHIRSSGDVTVLPEPLGETSE